MVLPERDGTLQHKSHTERGLDKIVVSSEYVTEIELGSIFYIYNYDLVYKKNE